MFKKIKDSKWLYVVLSVLMAIILWSYIIKDVNPEQTKTIDNIPITFVGTDVMATRNLIISKGEEQTMSLSVRAKADVISRLGRSNVALRVDVSKVIEPGDYRLMVEIIPPANVTPGTYYVDNDYDDLYVEFEVSKLEAKEIPVVGELEGSVAEGHQLGKVTVTPATISISGQQELVNQVAYAKVTLTMDELDKTYTGDLAFDYVGTDGSVLTSLNIKSNVDTVHVVFPVVRVQQVPLKVDLIPGGGATAENVEITFGPEKKSEMTIDVSGSEEELAGLNEVVVGQIDLAQLVGDDVLTFPIALAPELTNESGINEVTVNVAIKNLVTREFDVDNIQRINVPEGYTAEMVTLSRSVMIRGPKEAVDAVFESQLRIVADVTAGIPKAAVGRFTIPAKVYLDGSSTVGVVGTYNIVVSLNR